MSETSALEAFAAPARADTASSVCDASNRNAPIVLTTEFAATSRSRLPAAARVSEFFNAPAWICAGDRPPFASSSIADADS